MAGFLRKKSKQEPAPKPAPPPAAFPKNSDPPPLFARFATTAQPPPNATNQRIVSGPIPLANARRESYKAGPGRTGQITNTQISSREVDMARRRFQDQPQLSQASINFYAPSTPTGNYTPRPVSMDKPLPPPFGINEPVSPTATRRASAIRSPGPPPVFQPNQTNAVRPRTSGDFESKPLPRPGSAQAHFWQPEVKVPPSPNPKVMMHPARNGSMDTSQHESSPFPPSAGSHRLHKPHAQSLSQSSATPQRSQYPVSGQDFPRDNGNARSSNRMSMGAQRPPVGTPMSDRVDLPPEFALFQQFNESISGATPSTLKANQQVPSSSGPPSNIYDVNKRNSLKPQPSLPQFAPQRVVSPPLPPTPSDMGASASRLAMTDLLPSPSSYKDFHQPHVIASTNTRASSYINDADVIQHQPYQTPPAQIHNGSMLPHLPPDAAFAVNWNPSGGQSQDAALPARPPSSYQQQPTRSQMGQYQSTPNQPMLRKVPSVQGPNPLMSGKPKIFAAMQSQDNYSEPMSEKQFQPYPAEQSNPSQFRHDQRSSRDMQAQSRYLPNGQIQNQNQNQATPLLPSVELKTPRPRMDPLPNHFPNNPEADRRPTSVYRPSASPPKPSLPPAPQVESALHTPRSASSRSRSRSRQEEPQFGSPASGHRARKLSKPRHHENLPSLPHAHSGMVPSGGAEAYARSHVSDAGSPSKRPQTPPEPVVVLDEEVIRNAGLPLDEDPFAKPEGVHMLSPIAPSQTYDGLPSQSPSGTSAVVDEDFVPYHGPEPDLPAQVSAPQQSIPAMPLTPVSPEERPRRRKERRPKSTFYDIPVMPPMPHREPMTFPQFIGNPELLASLLSYLSFYDWCIMSAVSREIRIALVRSPALKEVVLEQYLRTVGYQRWQWEDQEPLSLSLQDLSDYMRGVSTPTHEYGRVAAMHVHSLTIHPNHRDPSLADTVRNLTSSTRAYNRVLLRLRAQAEKEASVFAASAGGVSSPPSASSSVARIANGGYAASGGRASSVSRVSSRAGSPTQSMYSYAQGSTPPAGPSPGGAASRPGPTFRSPLFRLRRAPLLRVFVPSPDGDWLSDKSVLECEAECRKAGILHLMRTGDVVWDVAVGDEGNVGRLVWDGSFLIDLDYTYSPIGDLPKYLPTLAFPPSYFHRVIRTGASTANPIVHIDVSPWGEEIALNLQLLQDRVRTETPQGAYHNVVRWVHRSSFTIRAPRQAARYPNGGASAKGGPPPAAARIPIPNTNNLFVDPGWYGTIVVETEGTNEALADLQARCGPGAFPPRVRGVNGMPRKTVTENKLVYRILREKSRPSEIWIRAVSVKERLM